MRIDPKASYHGVPMLQVRKYLKVLSGQLGSSKKGHLDEVATRALALPRSTAGALVKALLADGYLANQPMSGGWGTTARGNAFANASARVISRATADRIVAGLVERIKEINADDSYAWRVRLAVVFGSYLGNEARLGDVDVAVDVVQRFAKDKARQGTAINASMTRNTSELPWYRWPEHEVWMRLKNRQAGLSLLTWVGEEDLVLAGPHRVLYGSIDE